MLSVDGKPGDVQLPSSVELAVTETEPGVKGDTVSNVTKPATLETGAVVQVPLFVNIGDRVKVDPRERRYISQPALSEAFAHQPTAPGVGRTLGRVRRRRALGRGACPMRRTAACRTT